MHNDNNSGNYKMMLMDSLDLLLCVCLLSQWREVLSFLLLALTLIINQYEFLYHPVLDFPSYSSTGKIQSHC